MPDRRKPENQSAYAETRPLPRGADAARAASPASPDRGTLWLRPWRWLQRTLKRPVRLERRGAQIHVTLDAPRVRPPVPDPDEVAKRLLRMAQSELAELLGRHSAARSVVPHLSVLEAGLRKSGWRAIGKLPPAVLHAALKQLQQLIHNEATAGLAELRSRMASAIELHAMARRVGGDSDLSVPAHQRPEVSEASHSLFDEMERSWTGDLSAQLAASNETAKNA
jgi:hypothetical protein